MNEMRRRIFKSIVFERNPAHLILHVTNRCNLRCKTCFVDFNNQKGEKELTLGEIGEVGRYLKGLVWLDISGGEPFLRDDLPDICGQFDAGAISIPTNGFSSRRIYDMTKEIRNKTAAAVAVALSLDGFQKTNDYIRGDNCFKRAIETLQLLKKVKGIRVKINTVLCEKNYDEMIDFMRFIKQFDISFHSIIFLRGEARDPEYKCPTYGKLQEIERGIFEMWDTYNYGMKILEARILRNYQKCMYETSMKVIKENRQIPGCVAGRRHLVIYANGDVAFCEMLQPFGNLRRKRIEALLKSDDAGSQRKDIAAKRCYCYHNCNLLDNYFLNPFQYPKLLGGIWRR